MTQMNEVGVSQESLLGPLVFIVCTNDISSTLKNSCLKLFVDSKLLFFLGRNVGEMLSVLNSEVSRCTTY